MILPFDLAHTAFAPHVGENFHAVAPGVSVTLELANVRTLTAYNPDAPRAPFALTFKGRPGWYLPQGTYEFQHDALGSMEIFMTQVSDTPAGSEFEAVFN